MAAVVANHNTVVYNDFGGSGGNHVLSPPANLAAGDIWACFINVDCESGSGEVQTPSGWNKHYGRRNNSTEWPQGHLFWKVAGASESNVTFVVNNGGYETTGLSARITGANTTTPFGTPVNATDHANQNDPRTTYDPGTITVVNNGASVIQQLWGQKYGNATSDASMSTELTTAYTRGTGYCRGGLAYGTRDAGDFSPSDLAFVSTGWTRISITMVEVNPADASQSASYSESASAADSFSSQANFYNALTENVSAADSLTGELGGDRSITESVSAADLYVGTLIGSNMSVRVDRGRTMARGLGRGFA